MNTAVTVAIRSDSENALVLGAYTTREKALAALLDDIYTQTQMLLRWNQASADRIAAAIERLVEGLTSGEPYAVNDLVDFTWELQTVDLDAEPLETQCRTGDG